jgi:hypothetical protein
VSLTCRTCSSALAAPSSPTASIVVPILVSVSPFSQGAAARLPFVSRRAGRRVSHSAMGSRLASQLTISRGIDELCSSRATTVDATHLWNFSVAVPGHASNGQLDDDTIRPVLTVPLSTLTLLSLSTSLKSLLYTCNAHIARVKLYSDIYIAQVCVWSVASRYNCDRSLQHRYTRTVGLQPVSDEHL